MSAARLLHYHSSPLPPIYSVREQDPYRYKPRGLWVSVEGPDDWLSWCLSEGFRLENLTHVHAVELAPSARVLWLRSGACLDDFTEKYGEEHYVAHYRKIMWEKVALDWHGIVIAPYLWERRMADHTFWYYGWDCASGCIWNVDAIKHVTLLDVIDDPKLLQFERVAS